MIGQLQCHGKIGLTNAGVVIQVRVYGGLLRGFDSGKKNKNTKWVEGTFHKLSEEMRVSLVKMCI